MKGRQIVSAVMGTVLKVAFAVALVFLVYKGALIAYDYGYRVFNEPPVAADSDQGQDITVEVTIGKNTLQIGELLQKRGLIRDAKLFYIQNLLSSYKKKLKPGKYTLNTSMTMVEMMAVMAVEDKVETSEIQETLEE